MTTSPNDSRRRFLVIVAAVLLIHAALGVSAARQLTATHDEYWHLPVGLLSLRTGRFHFDNLNPPLCRMAAALPLLLTSAQTGPADAAHDAMGWGDAFVAANGARYDGLFALGRTVIVLLSVLGGFVTAWWARELFGDKAGCLAAILWAFEPNLLAHGALVTTDMGAAACFVFSMYAVWKFARRTNWRTALVFGLILGSAQLVKFTALILYPIAFAAFVLIKAALVQTPSTTESGVARASLRKTASMWLFALFVSLCVLNAGYLFRGSCSSLGGYAFQSATLRDVSNRLHAFRRAPVPLPRDYLEGLDRQRQVMEQKHPVFLDGQWSEEGFDHYYLSAMFYKVPHALPLLGIATLLWLVVPGGVARRVGLQAVLLLPAVALIVAAEGSGMQLGIRYVLPAIPFLILFASQAAQWLDFKSFPLRAVTTVLLTAAMLASVRYHPHHLAYFNELAGGPLGGREHLLDSNLDWGQDLGGLQKFLEKRGIREIGLAYFGTVPPSSRGIAYHIPPPQPPQPGWYAVSVNFVQGRPHWVRTPAGEIRPVNIGEFSYFAFPEFQPVAHIGYSIDVFELTARDVAAWRSALRQAAGR